MLVRRLEAVALFGVAFAIAWFVVANKHLVEHLLEVLGPFGVPVAIIIFALVASAPFSVTDALAISNGVIFGPWVGSAINALGVNGGTIYIAQGLYPWKSIPKIPKGIVRQLRIVGDRVLDEWRLQVPHLQLEQRAFPLVPLCQLAPPKLHPRLRLTLDEPRPRQPPMESNP